MYFISADKIFGLGGNHLIIQNLISTVIIHTLAQTSNSKKHLHLLVIALCQKLITLPEVIHENVFQLIFGNVDLFQHISFQTNGLGHPCGGGGYSGRFRMYL